jgi:hypothetical protein
MAATFGIIHQFKGATTEQYENTVKVVHPDGGRGLPPGQLEHMAGPTSDGFLVIAIWDSEDSWVQFRDGTLLPGLASVENGPPAPPTEIDFQIHATLSA